VYNGVGTLDEIAYDVIGVTGFGFWLTLSVPHEAFEDGRP
jgi:hypothetical protein